MILRTAFLLNLILILPFSVNASGSGDLYRSGLTGSVKIAGSSTVYPVTAGVAEEFNRIHSGVEIPIQSTGTGAGFENFFVQGKTDINNASRPINDEERSIAAGNGIDVIEIKVASDAITVVVSPRNDWVDNITISQLARMWRPESPAQTWRDVDPLWPDVPLELYGPTSASGTFDFFTKAVIGEEGSSRSDYQGTEHDNSIVQAINGSRFALGYFGMAYFLENRDKVKALDIEGISPGIESAESGIYRPLSRPLFIYVSRNSLKRPEVLEFVRFYIKQTSTDLIREIGYAPLSDREMRENLQRIDAIAADL
jgi:phosphate transport system substrate-binding protein